MTFRLIVDRSAQRDVDEAVEFLMGQAPDQVGRFLDDLQAAFDGISHNPLLTAEWRPGVRFRGLAVFSYGVWYRVFADLEIAEVFAVLHHRRGPDALGSRLL